MDFLLQQGRLAHHADNSAIAFMACCFCRLVASSRSQRCCLPSPVSVHCQTLAACGLLRTGTRTGLDSALRPVTSIAQERQVNWVVREYGNAQSIPTAVLLSYLRQELQVLPWLSFGLMSTVSSG